MARWQAPRVGLEGVHPAAAINLVSTIAAGSGPTNATRMRRQFPNASLPRWAWALRLIRTQALHLVRRPGLCVARSTSERQASFYPSPPPHKHRRAERQRLVSRWSGDEARAIDGDSAGVCLLCKIPLPHILLIYDWYLLRVTNYLLLLRTRVKYRLYLSGIVKSIPNYFE